MKRAKRFPSVLSFILFFPILLCSCGPVVPAETGLTTTPDRTPPAVSETVFGGILPVDTMPTLTGDLLLVGLGDSICRGYGLPDPASERYTSRLAGMLEALPEVNRVEILNDGIDGQTSSELLWRIREKAGELRLKDADVITVSIGANNALRYVWQLLRQFAEEGEHDGGANSEAILPFLAEITAIMPELRQNIREILTELSTINPKAVIVLNTIYNPFPDTNSEGTAIGSSFLSTVSESVVSQLNSALTDGAKGTGALIADVGAAFRTGWKDEPLTYQQNGLDPHPTPCGHRIIAETIMGVLKDKPKGGKDGS